VTFEEIAQKASKLRKEGISMSNYQRVFNDVLVLIRELAEKQKEKP
jgi:uncharacterized DUF497 family protein